ncbi:MAG: hypothetical protein IJ908_00260 [Fibrobacter sp.]|nr:hypothetical protein [Fibrobacter sp.]
MFLKKDTETMENDNVKYGMYEVACKCGHVGRSHYLEIRYPIIAQSGKDAAYRARYFPRVKHDHKDAILSVCKIDQQRFSELTEINERDPYLHCTCIQDQNLIDLSDRLLDEKETVYHMVRKDECNKDFYYKKQKLRDPKKYMKHYRDFCA